MQYTLSMIPLESFISRYFVSFLDFISWNCYCCPQKAYIRHALHATTHQVETWAPLTNFRKEGVVLPPRSRQDPSPSYDCLGHFLHHSRALPGADSGDWGGTVLLERWLVSDLPRCDLYCLRFHWKVCVAFPRSLFYRTFDDDSSSTTMLSFLFTFLPSRYIPKYVVVFSPKNLWTICKLNFVFDLLLKLFKV